MSDRNHRDRCARWYRASRSLHLPVGLAAGGQAAFRRRRLPPDAEGPDPAPAANRRTPFRIPSARPGVATRSDTPATPERATVAVPFLRVATPADPESERAPSPGSRPDPSPVPFPFSAPSQPLGEDTFAPLKHLVKRYFSNTQGYPPKFSFIHRKPAVLHRSPAVFHLPRTGLSPVAPPRPGARRDAGVAGGARSWSGLDGTGPPARYCRRSTCRRVANTAASVRRLMPSLASMFDT